MNKIKEKKCFTKESNPKWVSQSVWCKFQIQRLLLGGSEEKEKKEKTKVKDGEKKKKQGELINNLGVLWRN